MRSFVYTASPARVVFGTGTIDQIENEIRLLGANRALILSTAEQADQAHALSARIGKAAAGIFAGAVMHTPIEVTDKALSMVRDAGANCLVSIGGGSTIGLGKAIALRTDLPQIAIPTTYAGSEATPILGQTENGVKTTQRSPKIRPETILYDVDLSLSLPVGLSVVSAMNAIAHAVEALYAKDGNPIIDNLAEQGIAAIANALPNIVTNPLDKNARSYALFGAWACGTCLGSVSMSLHHKLCHTLGGSFELPHAETHTIILPHVAAYNAAAAPAAMRRIATILGARDAWTGLYDLARSLNAPIALKGLGFKASALERAADLACANPYWNPRPVGREAILRLLQDAYEGRPPSAAASETEGTFDA